MNTKQKRAVAQLMKIKKLAKELRLAADGWDTDWKTLIATLMSARTTDRVTIPIAARLFDEFDTVEKLAKAQENKIGEIIRGVNFYKTKAKNIVNLAKMLIEEHGGKVPHDFDKLVELPGVGRKTANVFLAEQGKGRIGVDTHVSWISQQMGWTKAKEQHKIEADLEKLFPEKYWGDINWILVRFGQTFPSRRKKLEILKGIKKIE